MLQAAPLRRPPGLQMRRISSTPTLKSLAGPKSDVRSQVNSRSNRRSRVDGRDDTRSQVNGRDDTRSQYNGNGNGDASTANGTSTDSDDDPLDTNGPLFCPYSLTLQSSPTQTLSLIPGTPPSCPTCRAPLPLIPGRAWKITKETLHERISTPAYDDEVVETRAFLISNRFVAKCHRERGFACVLCKDYRERDTVCESAEGLVRHVWLRHEARELLKELDIREVGLEEMEETKRVW